MPRNFCSALAGLVAALISAPVLAVEPDAACPADLAAVETSFAETVARLEVAWNAGHEEKCAAILHHIEVMTNGRDVFLRCLSGHAQRENAGQMNDSIEDFVYIAGEQGCEIEPPAKP